MIPQIKILQEDQSYTFSSYFDLPYETDDILREFHYSFIKTELSLPQTDRTVVDELLLIKEKIRRVLPLISLSSETARRETLVSPLLLEIITLIIILIIMNNIYKNIIILNTLYCDI